MAATGGGQAPPGPNSSSTVMPSAWASANATRSDGSECPDSTADTACLLTPGHRRQLLLGEPARLPREPQRRLAPGAPSPALLGFRRHVHGW